MVADSALQGLAAAVAAAIGWALYDLARRTLTDRMSAWALVVCVTVGAMPLLVAWTLWVGVSMPGPGYLAPALASVALNVAANFGYFRAFQLSPISVTLPMLSFTPLFASLLGALFLGEVITTRAALGALLVVAGGLALGVRGREFRIEAGSLVMLGVSFLWSATLLLDKRAIGVAAPELHALVLNAGVAVGGLLALACSRRLGDLGAARGHGTRILAAVSVGAAALTLQLVAMMVTPVGVVETIKRGIGGLSAVAAGRLVYGEALTPRKLGAVVAMAVGVALIVI